ncbi:MAG: hypothetical protein ACRD03_06220 [Acidimicrobiales bacterium]
MFAAVIAGTAPTEEAGVADIADFIAELEDDLEPARGDTSPPDGPPAEPTEASSWWPPERLFRKFVLLRGHIATSRVG